LYCQEISDLLSSFGSLVANVLLQDFSEAGIYPPTFLPDLQSKLNLFPHELVYQTYYVLQGPARLRFS